MILVLEQRRRCSFLHNINIVIIDNGDDEVHL